MKDGTNDMDHYVVETSTPRWLNTILVSIGGTLAAALLLWIANSQLTLVTTTAVMAEQVQHMTQIQTEQAKRYDGLLNQIWPRLRAHGSNIAILAREIESICKCKVKLTEPEEF